MNSREIVKEIISGGKPEYIPSGFWHHFGPDKAHGASAIKAHLDYLKETRVDILKIMNEDLYQLDTPIQKASDWAKIKPMKLSSKFFRDEIDIVRGVLDGIDRARIRTAIKALGNK
ncbi:MAG: hypothetical protein LLF89_01500 [Spirochaetaceae bacterium]|nr:hypothetical protein [Spirochaetaceae bacterium]